MSTKRKRLGELLIDRNFILPEMLDAALARQAESGKRLGQLVVEMGFVSYEDVMQALSEQLGIPHVYLRKGLVDPKVVRYLPREKAEYHQVIPMFLVRGITLTLAMADPASVFAIDDVRTLTGFDIRPVQCRKADIETAIREYYSDSVHMTDFLESFSESKIEVIETGTRFQDLRMVEEQAEGARIINLVNLILLNAINAGASDVHIEPEAKVTHVRYRIDGALQEIMAPGADLHPAIVSRIKVVSQMNIAERRLPQDGRIQIVADGKEVDVRVSTMPSVHGESVVMRLLDKTRLTLDINKIGIQEDALAKTKELLRSPHGILLVTGPTGSGKTTTLYCGLQFLNSVERKMVTIEDPVEFKLHRITQIQVQEEQQLTFSRVLRSVLRQDPDVIMVGEIRDRDTAEVAIQAALTGHLVLSTLHTNDSLSAVSRLADMGIEPFLLASSIRGVLAQRLVRTVCQKCRRNYFPPVELLRRIDWQGKNSTFVMGAGCDECFDSGLRGRIGIFELLEMTEALAESIVKDPSLRSARAQTRAAGMRTMRDEAFRLVEEGRTSLEEVMRIIMVDDLKSEGFAKTGT